MPVNSSLSVIVDKPFYLTMIEPTDNILSAARDCYLKQGIAATGMKEVAEADGTLDEREEMAIQRVAEALRAQNSLLSSAGNVIGSTASGVAAGAEIVGKSFGNTFSNTKSVFGALSNKIRSRK